MSSVQIPRLSPRVYRRVCKLASPTVAKQCGRLMVLSKATPRARKRMLEEADRETMKALLECVTNVVNGAVPVSEKCKNRLKRHKACWRKLVDRRLSMKKKKRLLVQKGGFLPAFVLPVLSALGSAIASKLL